MVDTRTQSQKQAIQNRVKQQNAAILQTTTPTPRVPAESWTLGNQSATHVDSTWATPSSWIDVIKQASIKKWDFLPTYLSLNRIREDLTAGKISREQAQSQAYSELTWEKAPISSSTTTPPKTATATSSIEEYNKRLWESAALEADKQKQDYLQTLERAGQIKDTQIQEQTKQKERFLEDQAINYDQYKYDIKQQLDKVIRDTSASQLSAKTAAALGGRIWSSAFQQWLSAASAEANRAIDELQRLEWIQGAQVDREKRRILEDYTENVKRITDDFNYNNRALIDWARVDVNALVEKYGLSSDKLSDALEQIDFDVEERRQAILGNYIANLQSVNNLHQSEVKAMYDYQDRYNAQQQEYAATYAAWSLNKTFNDINAAVENGYITPLNADAIKSEVVSTVVSTLDDISWVPWTWYSMLHDIQAWLEAWKTPREVIGELTWEAQQLWTKKAAFQPAPWIPWLFYRDVNGKIEYSTAPWMQTSASTTSVSTTTSWKQYTAIPPQSLTQSLQEYTQKYPDGVKWPRDGWCGQYVNDYLRNAGVSESSLFLDPIKDKMSLINSQTPTVGSVAVMNSITDPQYGHVGIVEKINADGSIVMKSSNFKWDGKVSTNTVRAANILWYFDPSKAKQASTWPVNSDWVPISYERRIKNLVPATLMNSEVELKQLNQVIKSLYDSWSTAEEAVLTYLGVDIPNDEDKKFATDLISRARWLSEVPNSFYSTLSDFVNRWDRDAAVSYLEREAMKQAQKNNPDIKISEAWAKFSVQQAVWIKELVDMYESQFWPLVWNVNDLSKWIVGNTKAQQLATKITQAVSKMRNDLVWSDITKTEKEAIEELIPSLSETAATAKVKLQNMIDTPLQQINALRDNVWLPQVDKDTLLNKKNRLQLYNTSWSPTTTQTQLDTNRLRSTIQKTARRTQMTWSSLINRLSD